MRIVEKINGIKWEKISFTKLKKGDIFRLFENNGKGPIVIAPNHSSVFIAGTDAYNTENDCWSIMIKQ